MYNIDKDKWVRLQEPDDTVFFETMCCLGDYVYVITNHLV